MGPPPAMTLIPIRWRGQDTNLLCIHSNGRFAVSPLRYLDVALTHLHRQNKDSLDFLGALLLLRKPFKAIMMTHYLRFYIPALLLISWSTASIGCGPGDLSKKSDLYFYSNAGIMACTANNGICKNINSRKSSDYIFDQPSISKDCTFSVKLGLTTDHSTYGSGILSLTGTIGKDKLIASGYFTSGTHGGLFTMIRH